MSWFNYPRPRNHCPTTHSKLKHEIGGLKRLRLRCKLITSLYELTRNKQVVASFEEQFKLVVS
jgi:hypothetical protein